MQLMVISIPGVSSAPARNHFPTGEPRVRGTMRATVHVARDGVPGEATRVRNVQPGGELPFPGVVMVRTFVDPEGRTCQVWNVAPSRKSDLFLPATMA
ncbi:MAG TPA: hypothetical protein VNP72_04115, partial [Longimicrobium sp.]|nr:hypothetical protein [Longimicrobium sp.]